MGGFIKLHAKDSVAVSLSDTMKGQIVDIDGQSLVLSNDIMTGHKVALIDIEQGQEIYKYGYSIGISTEYIPVGSHIHSHNMQSGLDREVVYSYKPNQGLTKKKTNNSQVVQLYPRSSYRFGIRNELWVLPLVSCVNMQAEGIVRGFRERYCPNDIDGVFSLFHPFGCSQLLRCKTTVPKNKFLLIPRWQEQGIVSGQ